MKKPKWTIRKEKIGKYNHYYFYDNEMGFYTICCIFDKNFKRYLNEFKSKNESYELDF